MKIVMAAAVVALLLNGMAWALLSAAASRGQVNDKMEQMTYQLSVTSPAFKDNEWIPMKYTADGDDMSPPLQWTGVPGGVAQYALDRRGPGRAARHSHTLGDVRHSGQL
jgi:hypothetical protein